MKRPGKIIPRETVNVSLPIIETSKWESAKKWFVDNEYFTRIYFCVIFGSGGNTSIILRRAELSKFISPIHCDKCHSECFKSNIYKSNYKTNYKKKK